MEEVDVTPASGLKPGGLPRHPRTRWPDRAGELGRASCGAHEELSDQHEVRGVVIETDLQDAAVLRLFGNRGDQLRASVGHPDCHDAPGAGGASLLPGSKQLLAGLAECEDEAIDDDPPPRLDHRLDPEIH